jgi:hypothetical protein
MSEHDVYDNSKITCLADVLNFAHKLDGSYWFRGHSKSSYKLLPSVLRPTPDGKYYDESKLLSEFVRRHPEANDKHANILEILTYAQHYGLPTRMLDWTENLLIAIYFACEDKGSVDHDGELFFLKTFPAKYDSFSDVVSNLSFWETVVMSQYHGNPFSFLYVKESIVNNLVNIMEADLAKYGMYYYFNDEKFLTVKNSIPPTGHNYILDDRPLKIKIDTGGPCKSFLSDSIYLYSPPMINKRLINQSGRFTIHTGKFSGEKQLIPVKDAAIFHSDIISSLIIPSITKSVILAELRRCGVHSSSVFPELEYLTNDIKSYCVV